MPGDEGKFTRAEVAERVALDALRHVREGGSPPLPQETWAGIVAALLSTRDAESALPPGTIAMPIADAEVYLRLLSIHTVKAKGVH